MDRILTTTLRALGVASLLLVAFALPASAAGHGTVLAADLTGAAEVTDIGGDPDGSGRATFEIHADEGEVCFDITTSGIEEPAAAHIHIGGAGSNGGVVVNLDWAANGSSGCVQAPSPDLVAITTNPSLYYVNVHTASFPAGAIRGQLTAAPALPAELAFTGASTTVLAVAGSAMVAAGALCVRAARRTDRDA